MKNPLIIAAVIILISSTAFAMGGRHDEGHQNMAFIMKKYLNLSESQQAEIEQLTAHKHKNMHEIRKRMFKQIMALNPEAVDYNTQLQVMAESQAEEIKQTIIKKGQLRAEIHALLNEEQKLKLKEVMEEMMTRHKKRNHHPY